MLGAVQTGREEELDLDASLGKAQGRIGLVTRSTKLRPGLMHRCAGACRLPTVARGA